jgi:hypothetical protein
MRSPAVLFLAGENGGEMRLRHKGHNSRPVRPMSASRATRILPATLVRAIVSLPLMLLATALWAAHAEHPTTTDLAIQAMLMLFMAALVVNVIFSVVAILRERHVLDPPEGAASSFATEQEQRPTRGASQGTAPASAQPLNERAPSRRALSER